MQIPALGVQDLAEEALADHVEDHHLGAIVVAVLHHHAVLAVFLGVLDELPAIVERHGRRDFGCRVLAVLHRCDADRHVPFPWRGIEDEIDVFGLTQSFEVTRSPGVTVGSFWPGRNDQFLHQLHAVFGDVADRGDAHAGNTKHVANVRCPLTPDTDKADADLRDGRRGKAGPRVFRGGLRSSAP